MLSGVNVCGCCSLICHMQATPDRALDSLMNLPPFLLLTLGIRFLSYDQHTAARRAGRN